MDEGPVERETVVVDTGSRGGGGGAIVALVVVLVLGVLAFLFFNGTFGNDKGDLNVNVDLPQVNLPPIHIDNPAPAQPSQPPPQQQPANQSGK